MLLYDVRYIRYNIYSSTKLEIYEYCIGFSNNYQERVLNSLIRDYHTPIKSFIIACLLNEFYRIRATEQEKEILRYLYHDGGCFYEWKFSTDGTESIILKNIIDKIPGLNFQFKLRYLNNGDYRCVQFNLDKNVFTKDYKRNIISLMQLKGII